MVPGRPRKLTDSQVAEIREWYAARLKLPKPKDILRAYGISTGTLSQICRGFQYKTSFRSG